MLQLPIHRALRVLLIAPHYPENIGAACRAMKTMGFTRFGLVRPGRLALPDHPMAQKMAVKSWDVLDQAEIYDNIHEAIVGVDCVVGTSARRGVSGVLSPSRLAHTLLPLAERRKQIVLLFGNEKSGLTTEELKICDFLLRVPIAADQPSLNLAQAVQVVCYELFASALRSRDGDDNNAGESGSDTDQP
jgi:TrmH family RNA methyltransferase